MPPCRGQNCLMPCERLWMLPPLTHTPCEAVPLHSQSALAEKWSVRPEPQWLCSGHSVPFTVQQPVRSRPPHNSWNRWCLMQHMPDYNAHSFVLRCASEPLMLMHTPTDASPLNQIPGALGAKPHAHSTTLSTFVRIFCCPCGASTYPKRSHPMLPTLRTSCKILSVHLLQ